MDGRTTLGRAGVMLLLQAAATAACVGDGDPAPEADRGLVQAGEIGLDLSLPVAADVTALAYTITREGIAQRNGTIPLSSDGNVRLQLGDLPEGAGYRISLTAQRADSPPCAGSATFAVTAGVTSELALVMHCARPAQEESGGSVAVTGSLNQCPSVPAITASAPGASVGEAITLSARARDEDAIAFAWSAASGVFSAPAAARTTFTCAAAGRVVVTVRANDSRGCPGVPATVAVACAPRPTAIFSSRSAYLVPLAPGVTTKALLSAGDVCDPEPGRGAGYRMVGLPEGLGAIDRGDGTFTLLSTHKLANSDGVARAHGGAGAFVSRWTVRAADLAVSRGADLIGAVQLWDAARSIHVAAERVAFARLGEADLAPISAFYDAASGLGFAARLLLSGEGSGDEGRAFAHDLDGTSYELPRLGHARWANLVANPLAQRKTVVCALDGAPLGPLYIYVGDKGERGAQLARAGLSDGLLYGVAAPGLAFAPDGSGAETPFTLVSLGDPAGADGAALEAASARQAVTRFHQLADGAWDPRQPGDFYFVSAGDSGTPSRLWRLRFSDIARPELGGTLAPLLEVGAPRSALTSLAIDTRGHIMLAEDPGNSPALARVLRYTIAQDSLIAVAQHDPATFTPGSAGFLTQDERAAGILDASDVLGPGNWLISDQVHHARGGELVEDGQLTALYDPGTL